MLVQFNARHAVQLDVNYQAVKPRPFVVGQKRLGGKIGNRLNASPPKANGSTSGRVCGHHQ